MKKYSDKLKDPRWQRKRLEIMQRDNFQCQYCFAKDETLTVHHKYYESGKDPWEYPDDCYVTLCEFHHTLFHEKFIKLYKSKLNGSNYIDPSMLMCQIWDVNATDVFLFERWIESLIFDDTKHGYKKAMDAIYPLLKKENIYLED